MQHQKWIQKWVLQRRTRVSTVGNFKYLIYYVGKKLNTVKCFIPSDPQNAGTRVTRGHTWFIRSLWGEGTRQATHGHGNTQQSKLTFLQDLAACPSVHCSHTHDTWSRPERPRTLLLDKGFITLVLSNCCLFV